VPLVVGRDLVKRFLPQTLLPREKKPPWFRRQRPSVTSPDLHHIASRQTPRTEQPSETVHSLPPGGSSPDHWEGWLAHPFTIRPHIVRKLRHKISRADASGKAAEVAHGFLGRIPNPPIRVEKEFFK
jgi:hypothetical protein